MGNFLQEHELASHNVDSLLNVYVSDIISSLILFNSHSPIFIGIVILVASRLVICSAL